MLLNNLTIFGDVLNFFLALWYIWVTLGVVLLIPIGFRTLEKHQLSKSGIYDIDKMTGKTFEKYLEVLFEQLGYQVERTRYIGDYGADIVIKKDNIKTIIQAKRFKSKVGLKAVQEAVAAKGYYGCNKAIVVTNSYYTRQAISLAKANDVALWDRNQLIKALLSIKPEVKETIKNNTPSISNNDICAICGKPVSEKIKQYCRSNPKRFNDKIYCYEHQKKQ